MSCFLQPICGTLCYRLGVCVWDIVCLCGCVCVYLVAAVEFFVHGMLKTQKLAVEGVFEEDGIFF